ncbi:MAG: hypothetical protein V9G24_05520 [Rhodoblastus sp.]
MAFSVLVFAVSGSSGLEMHPLFGPSDDTLEETPHGALVLAQLGRAAAARQRIGHVGDFIGVRRIRRAYAAEIVEVIVLRAGEIPVARRIEFGAASVADDVHARKKGGARAGHVAFVGPEIGNEEAVGIRLRRGRICREERIGALLDAAGPGRAHLREKIEARGR